MKLSIFGNTITTEDIKSPLFEKIERKIRHRFNPSTPWRYHPFELFPESLTPAWYMDIGANQGDLTKLALKSFPSCKAVCFEPVQSTAELLKQNLNSFEGRVHLFPFALGSKNETSQIHLTNFHGANSILTQSQAHQELNTHVRETGNIETISIRTLDSIQDELPSKHFDIVKIDVEGFEPEVLKGGHLFFTERVDWIFIEVALNRDEPKSKNPIPFQIFEQMNAIGFDLINITDISRYKKLDFEHIAQMDCLFRNRKLYAQE